MTRKDAIALRDLIHSESTAHCTVPNRQKPDGYFAQICTVIRKDGTEGASAAYRRFYSREDWEEYKRQRQAIRDAVERLRAAARRPRSPIEIMIDQACGFNPNEAHDDAQRIKEHQRGQS